MRDVDGRTIIADGSLSSTRVSLFFFPFIPNNLRPTLAVLASLEPPLSNFDPPDSIAGNAIF